MRVVENTKQLQKKRRKKEHSETHGVAAMRLVWGWRVRLRGAHCWLETYCPLHLESQETAEWAIKKGRFAVWPQIDLGATHSAAARFLASAADGGSGSPRFTQLCVLQMIGR